MPLIKQPPLPTGGAVLAGLHHINSKYGYLPEKALRNAAGELGVPLSRLYSAGAFYSAFSFKPRGRHTIHVCMGTACYIRGNDRLLEKLEAILEVKEGETTDDRAFTLEAKYCLGSCGMSPVIRVDDDIYGRLKTGHLTRILKKYRNKDAREQKSAE